MSFKSYPIKFHPILKSKIWGGEKLKSVLKKPAVGSDIGESWEISGVEGNVSVVANGAYKGKSLAELLALFGPQVLGTKVYKQFGDQFPLLIKFIDAKEDLSIQLHPNDQLAAERHNSFGKTEMWYVMQSDPEAKLIVGFNQKMTADLYNKHLNNKSLAEIMNFVPVTAGDTFFIEVGRVHAIGAGVMLAEIQQTSDITYRVYDWDRVDAQGQSRELHNDLAIDAIDFDMPDNFKVSYQQGINQSNPMVACPYFTTNMLPVEGSVKKNDPLDSFVIYMCVEGSGTISADGTEAPLNVGETVLIPAETKEICLSANKAKFLEVTI
jgi:mannose-6-phosphate isomerase